MAALRLSEIWIYPIKSLGGVRQAAAEVLEKGLKYDRRWMLIDDAGTFMTQRNNHQMALFKLVMGREGLLVEYKGDSIFLPFRHGMITTPLEATVWDDRVTVYEVGEEYSRWFTKHLGVSCRLVTFPEENARPVDPRYKIKDEHVSLADAYPFLIIGQASLDDLNSRLAAKVPMNRFRPNLVFTGGAPYEEDSWHHFKINTNRFAGVKPCARCILTTVDQETGQAGKEPLATLSAYRKTGNKVLFGQNVIAIDHHRIEEGDEITLE